MPSFVSNTLRRASDVIFSLLQMLNRVFLAVANTMRQQTFAKAYDPPVRALCHLLSQKPVAGLATSLQSWCPKNCTAREFEVISFLGPFLRPSVIYEDDVGTPTFLHIF